MNQPTEPKWKKIRAWIVLFWAVGVFIYALTSHPNPAASQAYMNGQYTGVLIAFLAFCWSIHYLFIRKI